MVSNHLIALAYLRGYKRFSFQVICLKWLSLFIIVGRSRENLKRWISYNSLLVRRTLYDRLIASIMSNQIFY